MIWVPPDRTEIKVLSRFEFYMAADGDYKATQDRDGNRKVWKWDGKRWRRRKEVPGHPERLLDKYQLEIRPGLP
jgi:hypothetical protein